MKLTLHLFEQVPHPHEVPISFYPLHRFNGPDEWRYKPDFLCPPSRTPLYLLKALSQGIVSWSDWISFSDNPIAVGDEEEPSNR
jgi:hypothetical protein